MIITCRSVICAPINAVLRRLGLVGVGWIISSTILASTEFNGVASSGVDVFRDGDSAFAVDANARLHQRWNSVEGRLEVRAIAAHSTWEERAELELRDAYLDLRGAGGRWRLGQQQIPWGRADGFRLLDSVNPLRFPDAYFEDPEKARRPLRLANWEYDGDIVTAQFFAGPDRRLHAAAPGYRPLFPALEELNRGSNDERRTAVAGVRVGRALGAVDAAIYGYDGWHHSPVLTDFGLTTLRRRFVGLSGDAPAGPIVFRAEAMTSSVYTDVVRNEPYTFSDRQWLLGMDYQRGQLFLSPQVYGDKRDPTRGESSSARTYFSLLVRYEFAQSLARLSAFAWSDTHYQDRWLSLRISRTWGQHLELRFAADYFKGENDALVASVDRLDRAHLGLSYHW